MKVNKNKAPEKIYLEWYRVGDKIYRDWCITPQTNNEPVEYVRTDAVIEKVCKWLDTKDDRDYYTIGYIKNHFQELIKEIGL